MVSLVSWLVSVDDSHIPLHGHASCKIHMMPLDAIFCEAKQKKKELLTYWKLKWEASSPIPLVLDLESEPWQCSINPQDTNKFQEVKSDQILIFSVTPKREELIENSTRSLHIDFSSYFETKVEAKNHYENPVNNQTKRTLHCNIFWSRHVHRWNTTTTKGICHRWSQNWKSTQQVEVIPTIWDLNQ
jgi:hypothetical protein